MRFNKINLHVLNIRSSPDLYSFCNLHHGLLSLFFREHSNLTLIDRASRSIIPTQQQINNLTFQASRDTWDWCYQSVNERNQNSRGDTGWLRHRKGDEGKAGQRRLHTRPAGLHRRLNSQGHNKARATLNPPGKECCSLTTEGDWPKGAVLSSDCQAA